MDGYCRDSEAATTKRDAENPQSVTAMNTTHTSELNLCYPSGTWKYREAATKHCKLEKGGKVSSEGSG